MADSSQCSECSIEEYFDTTTAIGLEVLRELEQVEPSSAVKLSQPRATSVEYIEDELQQPGLIAHGGRGW